MIPIRTLFNSPVFKCCFILVVLFFIAVPAFADLESGMVDLQGKIKSISTPLAIIFLIIAGWQKAMGNDHLFIAALVGTLIMFASPQIVEFISAAFGG